LQVNEKSLERGKSVPKITDLIDISILQQIQDWAAETAGVSILIRDADGFPVTHASFGSDFCTLISGEKHTNPACRQSNIIAADLAKEAGKPSKYTCFAGLTQFAAPIMIEGNFVGTIVAGDRQTEPISFETLRDLSEKFSIDFDKLLEASQQVKTWSDETMNSTINFLYTVANALLSLCYQGYNLNKNVKELIALLDISKLLTSNLSLQEVLDRIAEGIVKVLNVKASTIRLLDDDGVELVIKSIYNISPEYLSKGPVILDEHPICKSALNGEICMILDVTSDPKFGYNEAAKREGLCSMLCVGLKVKDKAVGTIHLYTGESHEFTEDEIMLAQSIANHAAIAIDNAKLNEQNIQKQRIERELAVAGEIQSELLPKTYPNLDRYDIKAKFIPYGQLSGDLYDFIELENQKIGLVIADVSGKGIPSAIIMATTHATIHASANDDVYKAVKVVDAVNKYLCQYTRATEFVTMFYGILDVKNHTLTYSNAGHNPPIVFREGIGVFLEQGGIPTGILEDAEYSEEPIVLIPGDVILLYTDGVTEALNTKREIFGMRRLMRVVQQNHKIDSEELINAIYSYMLEFIDGAPQSDDLTLIVIKVK
jgi:sigma-B regulation protein RsbU (phosphoserine phosphatase)